jgi:hypothetical protein
LINLAGAPDLLWNAPKPPALPLRELAVSLHTGPGAIGVFVADPDSPDQRPRRLPFTTRGEGISTCIEFVVPQLDYWTLVVVRMDEA